ncbi:hypothetical protein JCM19297_872 [Nonlabens ulvanivorans]|nr:hypothetical protein JCM19297_872 [Nonlabens ulvanivorans]
MSLSINEVSQTPFSIYPNPASDTISIYGGASQFDTISYQLYSITGQLVQNGIYNNDSVDVSELNSGLYLLQLYNENKLVDILKLIKE